LSQRIAFVFPGQGSQAVGMGADVYQASAAARAVFAAADEALGFSLSALCFEGPEATLRETVNTQPAIVATSLALLAALQEAAGADGHGTLLEPIHPAFVAGHSVGEYAAVAASGALDVVDALRLVRERGRLMHEEGLRVPSGMAAVLGMDSETLTTLCAEATKRTRVAQAGDDAAAHPGAGQVVVANDNAPGQIVISGASDALEIASEMARAVAAAPVRDASVPIIANITAEPIQNETQVRAELAQQIVSPVQWTRTVEYLAGQGVEVFVEIGPGQVLGGLIKRIAKGATILSVSAAADVAPVAGRLVG
jgi:[acyl-carrier-protein] S-malonyltransferase